MKNTLKPKKQKKSFITRFKNFAIVVFLGYGFFVLISQQVVVSQKKDEINDLKNKVEVASQQNDEYQYLMKISDTEEYMRRIAIEKLGYAYPDEIRVYDTSKN